MDEKPCELVGLQYSPFNTELCAFGYKATTEPPKAWMASEAGWTTTRGLPPYRWS